MKILLLYTGNSCRSQMAHGFLQSFAPSWIVESAGTRVREEFYNLYIKVKEDN